MSLDPDISTALEQQVVPIRWLLFANFDGDPLRWTSAIYDRTFGGSETGDPDLDGQTFEAMDSHGDTEPLLIEIGDIVQAEGGSDTFTISLGALVLKDTGLLNLIGDRTKWQGRKVRVWWYVEDTDGSIIGDVPVSCYKVRFSAMDIAGDPSKQTVIASAESYLSILSGSTGRTWGQQKEYDSGDTSSAATTANANGTNQKTVPGITLPNGVTLPAGINFGGFGLFY